GMVGAVKVLAAFARDGACVGAMFLIAHQSKLYGLWTAAPQKYQRQYVNHVMYRAAIEWALESGFENFDLGRSDVRGGAAAFKRKFGAAPQQLFYYEFDRAGARRQALPRRGMSVGSALLRRLPPSMTDAPGAYVCRALFSLP